MLKYTNIFFLSIVGIKFPQELTKQVSMKWINSLPSYFFIYYDQICKFYKSQDRAII